MKDESLQLLQFATGDSLAGHGSQTLFGGGSGLISLPRPLVIILAVVTAAGIVLGVAPHPALAPAIHKKIETTEA